MYVLQADETRYISFGGLNKNNTSEQHKSAPKL